MFEWDAGESVPSREERVLRLWKQQHIFEKSISQRQGARRFTFYDGPPFATGLPHYGHILAGTIKDVVPRYKAMKGYYVPRRFGWDCHGLPVENEIEKTQGLSGAPSIEAFGIGAFNEECRSIVLRYTEQWQQSVERVGRWVSFENTYRTMDRSFMESVWWVFAELYKKGLVYQGVKVMPFSTKLGTPLSNFEANLNYKEVDDPSVTLKFELVSRPGVFLLVWTTTPWTLPSNLAVMVKPELDYIQIREKEKKGEWILAESAIGRYITGEYEIVGRYKGAELIGEGYHPLFSYFVSSVSANAFTVIGSEEVSSEEGTGLVHSAPAFGEVDFFACAKAGIDIVNPVDHNGKFTAEVPDFAGMFIKDADKEILRRLKQEGKVFHQGQIRHRYPFCWRSDTPLIYKAVSTWFVSVEALKEKMLKANAQIHWVPDHLKEGRFGKWLENARDWAISRNRYWGTPIPLWQSEDGEILVISSVAELEAKTGATVTDLHRHFIDQLEIIQEGKVFRRVSEVFDCWFESGSMPYAQDHYPFENKAEVEASFPADFIAEGLDQTRGWFYTLTVLAAALFDSPAFQHVIVNGIVLAEDGQKMSKRLKNYPEPLEVVNRYGADAVRLYLLGSPAVYAEDLRFSERGVELTLRQVLIPLWNSFVFFSTYAKIYAWKPAPLVPPQAEIDRWLLSMTHRLIDEVTQAMDSYQLHLAVAPFMGFVEQLTNWYIRRSRSRFWADEDSPDRQEAFGTLYHVLMLVTKVAAPFVPFLTEALYLQLRTPSDPESIHLCDFPQVDQSLRDPVLEMQMQRAQEAVSLGHALRKEHKLKVRQPLAAAYLVSSDAALLEALKPKAQLIAEELNVKEVRFESDETAFVSWIAKPNFRVLGKKVGKLMQAAQAKISGLTSQELSLLADKKSVTLEIEGEKIILTAEDVEVQRQVKPGLIASTAGALIVALDTALTEDLLLEGLARELINKVNTMRKEAGFEIVDRIALCLQASERLQAAIEAHRRLIMHETLAVQILFDAKEGVSWDLNGEPTLIQLSKRS